MKFEDAIAQIKQRVDIADIIGQYVKLKKSGKNYTGLCPFHSEKTPSFHVRADQGYFKCFGCGEAGDVFTFVEKKTGQLFVDIVHKLASENGITIDTAQPGDDKKVSARRSSLLKCLNVAQQYFQHCLKSRGEALPLAYLTQERRLTPLLIDSRQLGFGGFDDKDLVAALQTQQIPLEDALELGLLREGSRGVYGFFSRRITVPIFDHRGQIVGFGGRSFGSFAEGRPKYVNSPVSPIYDKGKVLYGLFESLPLLKQGMPLVITEGYFDVISVFDVGFAAVAPCGTSLTDEHIGLISRFTKEVILCLDQDRAGQQAQQKILLAMLKAGFSVRAAQIQQKDPDVLWRSGKREELRQALADAPDAVEALIRQKGAKSIVGVGERVATITSLLPFVGASLNQLRNRQYIRLLSKVFKEDESLLLKETYKISPLPQRSVRVSSRKASMTVRWSEAEKLLLRAAISHPRIVFDFDGLASLALNRELREFLSAWQQKLAIDSQVSPREALRDVPVARGTFVIQIILESMSYGTLISEEDARRVLADFSEREEKKEQRDRIGKNHENLLAAQNEGDFDTIRQVLKKQSEDLKSRMPVPKTKHHDEKDKKNNELGNRFQKFSSSNALKTPSEEVWSDDEGWT